MIGSSSGGGAGFGGYEGCRKGTGGFFNEGMTSLRINLRSN